MRAHAPGRPKFRPRRRKNEERCQRALLGDAPQHIEGRRIGPVQILERQHYGLHLGARHNPVSQCSQLPSAQFLARYCRHALLGQGHIEKRGKKRHHLGRLELHLRE